MISIAYYDLGALFPADNYRHFGGLSYYRPAAYVGPCWPQIGQKSIFCAISASPLKIKLQSTVRAQELTPTTPPDKWALVIRVYDTPALTKGVWIFNPEEMAVERISTEICAKSRRFLECGVRPDNCHSPGRMRQDPFV